MVWNPQGMYVDFGVHFGSVVLGLNSAKVSVGQDVTRAETSAVAYIYAPQPSGSTLRRVLLAPPKNTAWVGTATSINDAGRIVGYATFAGGGRAVEFFQNRSAAVLPVAAAGVSSSAQAINVHGDVVGNAGSQAFIYKIIGSLIFHDRLGKPQATQSLIPLTQATPWSETSLRVPGKPHSCT